MKCFNFTTTTLAVILACFLAVQVGCTSKAPEKSGGEDGKKTEAKTNEKTEAAAHDHSHGDIHPKYHQVYAEFPGHRHAIEIIVDESNGGAIAYLTDAHFEAKEFGVTEIIVSCMIDGSPKTFTLSREGTDTPEKFVSDDKELGNVIQHGWTGTATARFQLGERPYSVDLKRDDHAKPAPVVDGHDHDDHEGHEH